MMVNLKTRQLASFLVFTYLIQLVVKSINSKGLLGEDAEIGPRSE
ncbi:hypothetical protein SAMN05878482_102281 [Peribacillus simplex]|uniref:Uncharacterized protein n=1 Tax=Peribacillus simplex TaxID=1478 RepID=A0A9X8R7B4_9BACI|nr:hypothetical protein SAMN05878482_102281 [Peribacillus simplex]